LFTTGCGEDEDNIVVGFFQSLQASICRLGAHAIGFAENDHAASMRWWSHCQCTLKVADESNGDLECVRQGDIVVGVLRFATQFFPKGANLIITQAQQRGAIVSGFGRWWEGEYEANSRMLKLGSPAAIGAFVAGFDACFR